MGLGNRRRQLFVTDRKFTMIHKDDSPLKINDERSTEKSAERFKSI